MDNSLDRSKPADARRFRKMMWAMLTRDEACHQHFMQLDDPKSLDEIRACIDGAPEPATPIQNGDEQ